ncbi:MAG: hypothetical protein WBN08_07545 [Thiogranum sp.]
MRTDRHNNRNSTARWEIILGVLFVVSFLGVTLALTISDAVAAPGSSEHEVLQ